MLSFRQFLLVIMVGTLLISIVVFLGRHCGEARPVAELIESDAGESESESEYKR